MNGRTFATKRGRILNRPGTDKHRKKALAHLVREAGAKPIFVDGKLVGHRLPDGFMACVKVRFCSLSVAERELAFIRLNAQRQPHKAPVRAYHCPYCRGWHLTSRA